MQTVILATGKPPNFVATEKKSQLSFGIWSWSQSNFTTPEALKNMLEFCTAENISHIDQHISITKTEDGYLVKNAESLKQLLQVAKRHNISINALRGERTMFFAENHDSALGHLKAIVEFNRGLPKEARFAGIKYDVEPYLTPEWRAGGDSQKKVISDYLTFLQEARAFLAKQAEGFELSVDIPFWWDKPEFSCSLNGKNKLLIHHIIDLTDWIGIMSYRRESSEVIRLTSEEFNCAALINKSSCIAPGVNTAAQKGEESWTSFDGVPPPKFRKTLTELQQTLSKVKATRLIMIHDYKGLVKYLESE